MSVDVATLVFEFKSDSAATAEQRMDALIAKGERLEAVAKKTRLASDGLNAAHRGAAGASEEAARSAANLASAEGAVERSTRAAGRASAEVRAQRQLEAAAMRELAQATRAYERDQVATARAVDRLRASVDPLQASIDRVNKEIAEANRLHAMGALSAEEHARAVQVLDARIVGMRDAQAKGLLSTKALTQAGLNLSRQFADVGVSLAMGMNPLMVLIQQGPQVADVFAQAKTQGLGFRAVIGGIVGGLGPLLPMLAAVAAIGGVVFGAAALGARELNKDNKNLVAGLGLTEKQLDRLKDKGVNTAVTIGDVFRGTFNYLKDAIGPSLAPIAKWFSDLFDAAAKGAVASVKVIGGAFVGAFSAIKSVWSDLPRAIGDVAVQAANSVIGAVERMINASITAYNKALPLIRALMMSTGNAAGAFALQAGGPVALDRLENPNQGAAADVMEKAAKEFAETNARWSKGVDNVLDGMGKSILKATADRLKKAAGDAGKTPKGAADPRDMTDERAAQIAGLIAQAMQDELQARLALAREANERAAIERQISAAQLAEKQAQIDRQIAAVEDAKGLSASAKALLTFQLEAVQAMNERTAALKSAAISEAEQAALAAEALETQQANLRNHIDLLGAQADLTKSSFARAVIERDILKAQQELEKATLRAVTVANGATAAAEADAQRRLAVLDQIHELELAQVNQQSRLVDALGEAVDAVEGFKNAWKRHDFAGVLDNLQRTIQTIQASFAANGMKGGLMTAGSAAASLIGGKTGNAIGTGLGIAGLGMSAAPMLGAVMTAFPSLMAGAAGTAALAIAPLLGPIGMAAGALYAAAKLLNVGGKPSNNGAGYDLITGQFSGNRRNEETEGAARAAGDTILAAQKAMEAAGIKLGATVNGLVIGTRDLSQIYLSNGRTLTSAVGGSAAAVDAALRGILEGATFQSEAQKKLVDSAIAAGKGFDELTAILDTYAQAQKLAASVDDQILQLTDPKAFDLQAVTRDIQAQRDAAKELEKQGYLTSEQLSDLTAKLATLEGLQTKAVLDRYGAANDNANALATATEAAKDGLMNAYQAFSQAKQAEIAAARQTAEAFRSLRQELSIGALAGRDPTSQYLATKKEFDRLNALAANDPERVANLGAVGRAFVEASRAASPTQLAFERDLGAVRRATEASEKAANDQADIAQAQLNAATAQLEALGLLNTTTLSMADALTAYLAAKAAEDAAKGPPKSSNDNAFDVSRYLTNNPDLVQNWDQGGIMRTWGASLEAAARYHYDNLGISEISKGLRGYATGGSFTVGGSGGTDSQLVQFMATPGEHVEVRTPGQNRGQDNGEVVAELRALRKEVADLRKAAEQTSKSTGNMDARGKKQEIFGAYVRGEAPGDPVKVAS